jgi:FAD binding domain
MKCGGGWLLPIPSMMLRCRPFSFLGILRLDTQVIIVGAGPVGLTLAIDLGRCGVGCILLEQKEAPQFLPKMERCNA